MSFRECRSHCYDCVVSCLNATLSLLLCRFKESDTTTATELATSFDTHANLWMESYCDVCDRLLLLGASDAGKTTLMRQWKTVSSDKSPDVSLPFKPCWSTSDAPSCLPVTAESSAQPTAVEMQVKRDIVRGFVMVALFEAVSEFKEFFGARLTHKGDTELRDKVLSLKRGTNLTVAFAKVISDFYGEESADSRLFRQFLTIPHCDILQFGHALGYFIQRITAIAAKSYVPTATDMLRVRIKSTGIQETRFQGCTKAFSVVDVGGSRAERRKWELCFVNSRCVIYCVNVAEFDENCLEDVNRNKLQESFSVWKRLCADKWVGTLPVHLVFTKCDLLSAKLRCKDAPVFSDYCPNFLSFYRRQVKHHFGADKLQQDIAASNGGFLYDCILSFMIRTYLKTLPSKLKCYFSDGTRVDADSVYLKSLQFGEGTVGDEHYEGAHESDATSAMAEMRASATGGRIPVRQKSFTESAEVSQLNGDKMMKGRMVGDATVAGQFEVTHVSKLRKSSTNVVSSVDKMWATANEYTDDSHSVGLLLGTSTRSLEYSSEAMERPRAMRLEMRSLCEEHELLTEMSKSKTMSMTKSGATATALLSSVASDYILTAEHSSSEETTTQLKTPRFGENAAVSHSEEEAGTRKPMAEVVTDECSVVFHVVDSLQYSDAMAVLNTAALRIEHCTVSRSPSQKLTSGSSGRRRVKRRVTRK